MLRLHNSLQNKIRTPTKVGVFCYRAYFVLDEILHWREEGSEKKMNETKIFFLFIIPGHCDIVLCDL